MRKKRNYFVLDSECFSPVLLGPLRAYESLGILLKDRLDSVGP